MPQSIFPPKWRFALCLLLLAALLPACSLTASNSTGGQTNISGQPVVRLVAPQPNATYLEGIPVNIQASVSNAGSDIDRVEISVDGAVVTALPSPNAAGAPTFSASYSWPAKGVGQHTINVTAFRHDGSSSAPVSVNVNVVSQTSGGSTGGQAGTTGGGQTTGSQTTGGTTGGQTSGGNTGGGLPTLAPPPSATLPPTQSAPTNPPPPSNTPTPSVPTGTINQGANVRRGPSVLFNPPMGSLAANSTVTILAVNTAHDWYKVQYYNAPGWIAANLLTFSGDLASLPVDDGPPVPTLTPVPPTPVPVTNTPTSQANLVAGNIRTQPAQPKCSQTFQVFVDVANQGSQANASGGTLRVQDIHVSDGAVDQTSTGAFGVIQPGQTVASGPIPFTVSTYFSEEHKIVITIDPDNQVSETNKNDNQSSMTYTLAVGNC
jgi:Big-like domain-containing protein/CARDB protein